jgi:hypothetical protein
MQPTEAQRIVQAYGDVLAENTATGVVRDINSLPHSKDQIKTALRFALKVTSDPAMRGHFKAAYISLADFQPLSDEEIQLLQKWNKVLATGAAKTTEIDDASAAAIIADTSKGVTRLNAHVTAEANTLMQELETAGLA